jgi:hypothetical protein
MAEKYTVDQVFKEREILEDKINLMITMFKSQLPLNYGVLVDDLTHFPIEDQIKHIDSNRHLILTVTHKL